MESLITILRLLSNYKFQVVFLFVLVFVFILFSLSDGNSNNMGEHIRGEKEDIKQRNRFGDNPFE